MTDAEKVLQPNNQTHLWCATCHGWWPKPEGCPHHQDDAEKVQEGPLAVLADVLFYDPADRKRLEAALDSILTELAEDDKDIASLISIEIDLRKRLAAAEERVRRAEEAESIRFHEKRAAEERAEKAEDERGVYRKHYFEWKERAEKAEEEREEWRKAFQGKQLYPISEMEQKLAREQGKREDAEARIQELEAENDRLRQGLVEVIEDEA